MVDFAVDCPLPCGGGLTISSARFTSAQTLLQSRWSAAVPGDTDPVFVRRRCRCHPLGPLGRPKHSAIQTLSVPMGTWTRTSVDYLRYLRVLRRSGCPSTRVLPSRRCMGQPLCYAARRGHTGEPSVAPVSRPRRSSALRLPLTFLGLDRDVVRAWYSVFAPLPPRRTPL